MLTFVRLGLFAAVLTSGCAAMPNSDAADPDPPPRPARPADAGPDASRGAGGRIDVDMVGVVRTGAMAIGGESTGTTVSAVGFTWELDLGGNEAFAELVREANGKELNVTGTVTVKQGVERGRRVIVVVRELKPAGT